MKDVKLKPIGKGTVVDQIVNELTDSIITGNYKTGTKLPNEFELMEKLCVSRASLREAMKVLSALGVVEIRRGDGTYISSQVNTSLFDKLIYSMISETSSSRELLELRQILDETTIFFAMRTITEDEIELLNQNVQEMSKALKEGDLETVKVKDFDFHMTMINSCKNIFFNHIMQGVYSIFEKAIYDTVNSEKIDSKAAVYHQQMIECLKTKDGERVSEIVSNSLKTWKNNISKEKKEK